MMRIDEQTQISVAKSILSKDIGKQAIKKLIEQCLERACYEDSTVEFLVEVLKLHAKYC
jgi:hypothetical protein